MHAGLALYGTNNATEHTTFIFWQITYLLTYLQECKVLWTKHDMHKT